MEGDKKGDVTRVLIVGFQRSGTTLLRRLFCQHPDVGYVIHEGRLLLQADTKKGVLREATRIMRKIGIQWDVERDTWGDKVPFCAPTADSAASYCRRWKAIFGEAARIVTIVRHPYDIAMSSKRLFKQRPLRILGMQQTFIPELLEYVSGESQAMVVKFEELCREPEPTLREAFEFCGLRRQGAAKKVALSGKAELRYFDGIEPSRAFAYKRSGKPKGTYDLTELLDAMNEVPGPRYKP